MKKEEIEKKLQDIKLEVGNLQISSGIVWNIKQLGEVITKNDRQNEIVKIEITKGFEPGKKCYLYIIYKYPPINLK